VFEDFKTLTGIDFYFREVSNWISHWLHRKSAMVLLFPFWNQVMCFWQGNL